MLAVEEKISKYTKEYSAYKSIIEGDKFHYRIEFNTVFEDWILSKFLIIGDSMFDGSTENPEQFWKKGYGVDVFTLSSYS